MPMSSSFDTWHCPHCSEGHLERMRLPGYLRLLRVVGIPVRLYACSHCGKRRLLWR